MGDPNFKMMYLGTARLLCETHAHLVRSGSCPDDVADMMESFVSDFNAAELSLVISPTGAGTYGIFSRDQIKDDE